MRHWAAVEADLAREYGLSAGEVAGLSARRFLVLLGGLPPEAGFPEAWRSTPRLVEDPAEIARITALAQ